MTAAKKKNQPTSVLDQPWRYGYVSRPILWACAIWGIAVAIHGLNVETWQVAAGGMLLALLAGFASHYGHGGFALTLGVITTAYLTWCAHGTPFTKTAGLALIPGTAIFGVWWRLLSQIETDPETEQAKAAEKAVKDRDLVKILANAGFKGIEPGPVEQFEAGRMQRLILPANGSITFKRLHAATEQIEIAARAKFPIRFTPGSHAAEVVAIMLDRDVLAETLPYPVDRAPRSIHDPMPLGMDELGAVKVITFRELSAMFVGERGSGKSGLLNAHLAFLTGCTDALVWMIDGKGGRTARPWIQPFLDGLGKPAIDWVAITPEEAEFMLLAARAVIDHRSHGPGEKVEPSPEQPAIILIVEEASLVTGTGDGANARRAALAKENTVLGRSEAVDSVFVAQRGTVTMLGSGDMKSQLQYIVGLGISKMEDAIRIFGDATLAREALRYAGDLAYRGVMLVKAPGWKSVLPVKGYWLAPPLIPGVALTNASHRPELEPDALSHVEDWLKRAGCPGGYASRWTRFRAGLSHPVASHSSHPAAGETSHPSASGTSHRDVSPTSHPAGSETSETPAGETSRLGPTYAQDLVAKVKAEQQAKFEQRRLAAERDEFERLTSPEVWGAVPPADIPTEERDDPDAIPPFLRHMRAVFAGRDDENLPTSLILEQMPGDLTAKALSLLAKHLDFGPREGLPFEGERVRGYRRIDVERAFTRARDSGAPRAAFDWEP